MAPSFDAIGWFAASPGVFRRVGPVLLDGARVAAPIRRLLIADDAFAEADAAVVSVVRDAIARMQPDLPVPEHVRLAPDGLDAWRETLRVIQAYEVWQTFGPFVEAAKPKLGPGIAERIAAASNVSKADADAARATQAKIRRNIEALIAPGTIVALPTAPCIAPRLDTPSADLEPFRLRVMRLICTAVLGGLPQVSLPAGTVSGCPVGLSFMGWGGGDEALLELAFAVSRHLGVDGGS
jgi:amidase